METITLALKDIKSDPDLERKKITKPQESGGFRTIKESIKNIGLKEPLIVYKDKDTHFLCDGYNRKMAMEELKDTGELPENLDIDSIKCIVVPRDTKNIIRYMTDIRQDLEPSLKAEKIEILFKKGMSRKDIARMCGYSVNTIRNWLNVSRLSNSLKDLMDRNYLPVDSAVAISPLNELGQQNLFNKLKDWKTIRRDEVRNLVSTFPNKYFRMNKAERHELAKKLKSRPTEQKQSISERKILSKSLHKLSIEKDYLDNEIRIFRTRTRRLVAWIERILRQEEIRGYVLNKHSNILNDFNFIIEVELGKR